ncbi:ubiquinone/menaquinone biosynthesis C-methylase UbiE [Mycobacterium frederiksbergense]|uniref:Ubiquinone/menaquinone biosynthesis C-methylase UbiE n=1 Tax=Mycolicibacterium frederiksbergense TaxID=117567 RepID=A0ABT6L2I2_9MYCO|nr:class I SAM-dependent methyltransferase [Mycolicibacterium frederiksbergense]MDH6197144.1 ubiquinone/menaquinone biosynthesis C-methylase UbiE [Mycolicibacterium frederiksbergense]
MSAVDLGCGHGGVTDRMARRVGESGTVYAVDASADQLQIARSALIHHRNITFIDSALEDDPLRGRRVDWVYSRFLLMHVRDLRRALDAMADMLTDDGALLLEIADVGTARFSPADPDSDLWLPWWYALGQARGLSFDVADTIENALDAAGFAIHRRDQYQPISSSREAKLVQALGFEQCVPAYLTEIGVAPARIDTHRKYLNRVLDDQGVTFALFNSTQIIARRR